MCKGVGMEIDAETPKKDKFEREKKKGGFKKPSSMLFLSTCLVAGMFIILMCQALEPVKHAVRGSIASPPDICSGKRVYMYDLPPQFNVDLSNRTRCNKKLISWMDLCPRFDNNGYGLKLWNESKVSEFEDGFDRSNWYDTDSYMLEVIFHNRMKHYHCLTEQPAAADAFFVPYYTGLQALTHLYPRYVKNDLRTSNQLLEARKSFGTELMDWLQEHGGEQWRRFGSKDHFLILGRTTWDFKFGTGWGTGFSALPYVDNMTRLLIERNHYLPNEHGIPYPTSFHPSSPARLASWISGVKRAERKYLFSYVGAPRPNLHTARGVLASQCINATESVCKMVNCSIVKCSHDPFSIYKVFLQSNFCLQPRGDTYTRRSTFDCLISGAIPVLFHNDSAYLQYSWHLPQDHESYTVYIPESDLTSKEVSIQKVLMGYSQEKIRAMTEKIVSLIPSLIYNDYSNHPWGSSKDAFEISVDSVLRKVDSMKKESLNTRWHGAESGQ